MSILLEFQEVVSAVDLTARAGIGAQTQGSTNVARSITGRAAASSVTRALANVAYALNVRLAGSTNTRGAASIARAIAARVFGSTTTRAATNVGRGMTVRVSGSSITRAATNVARALAVRAVGQSAVRALLDAGAGAIAIAGTIAGRASALGSLTMARALNAKVSGQTLTLAGQRVAYALSSIVQGRTSARPNMRAAFALTSRITGRAATLATTGIARAITASVATGARVVNSLPPLVTEVVGIIRIFLRASMELIGIKSSMRRDAIVARAETETLITAQHRQPIESSVKKRAPIVVSATNMIAKNVSLKGYVIGDDTEIAFQLTDWPAGVLLSKAYFTMKKSLKDLDAAAIIQRDITITLTAEGQITANGSLGTAEGYFLIRHQDAEWANVKPNTVYEFDIQSITDQATVQTPIVGTISFVKGRTDATS